MEKCAKTTFWPLASFFGNSGDIFQQIKLIHTSYPKFGFNWPKSVREKEFWQKNVTRDYTCTDRLKFCNWNDGKILFFPNCRHFLKIRDRVLYNRNSLTIIIIFTIFKKKSAKSGILTNFKAWWFKQVQLWKIWKKIKFHVCGLEWLSSSHRTCKNSNI